MSGENRSESFAERSAVPSWEHLRPGGRPPSPFGMVRETALEGEDRRRRIMVPISVDALLEIQSLTARDLAESHRPALADLLTQVFREIAAGNHVDLRPLPDELTTTQAARMLRCSRSTVLRAIDEGSLPAYRVGTHWRLETSEVLAQITDRRSRFYFPPW